MTLSLNRWTGIACSVFGLCLILFIIPDQVDAIEDSGIQPTTIPKATAWIILVAGAIHALFPTGDTTFDKEETVRAAIYLAIVGGGVFAMSQVGFEYVAPVMILAIMAVMGERRWYVLWTIALPVGIWAMLEFWLNRPLP